MSEYDSWQLRERPDFALRHVRDSEPFGVEVTNHFRSESQARAVMIDGYVGELLAGGKHRHKDDAGELTVSRLRITTPDGGLKAEDVPGILTPVASPAQRREGLKGVLRRKAALDYEASGLTHTNLVIMDWLEASFDPGNYSSSAFIDRGMRDLLLKSPFREVFVVLAARPPAEDEASSSGRFVIRLVEFLLASEYFLTGAALLESPAGKNLTTAEELEMAIARHLTAGRGTGHAVRADGRVWVHLGDSMAGLSDEGGLQIRQLADWPLVAQEVDPGEVPSGLQKEVDAFVGQHDFSWGFATVADSEPPLTG